MEGKRALILAKILLSGESWRHTFFLAHNDMGQEPIGVFLSKGCFIIPFWAEDVSIAKCVDKNYLSPVQT